MVLFSIKGDKLKKVHRIDFKLDKDIQKITEKNIGPIFGLNFVKSEFQLEHFRIDKLTFERFNYIKTILRQFV